MKKEVLDGASKSTTLELKEFTETAAWVLEMNHHWEISGFLKASGSLLPGLGPGKKKGKSMEEKNIVLAF